jgi:ribose transport system permease protein
MKLESRDIDRPATEVVPAEPARPPRGRSRSAGIAHLVEAWALLAATIGLMVFFSVLPATSETFPTVANLQATLGNQSVLAILALAVLIPLIANSYDLSVGATLAVSSIFAASAMSSGAPILVALALVLGIGLVVGVANGMLVTRAGVDSFIVTLGTAIVIEGVVLWKSGGKSIVDGIPQSLTSFGSNSFLEIPLLVYVALAAAGLVYFVLGHTPYGRRVQAIGSNAKAARLVGIGVNRLTLSTFVLGGMLAGVAGLLQVARSGAGNPQIGPGYTLPAFAAAFLSIAAVKPGRFNPWGLMVAILFLATLNSGLNLAGVNTYVNDFANGLALIAGVSIAGIFGRRRSREV